MLEENTKKRPHKFITIKIIIHSIFISLLCVFVLSSGWLATNVFNYEITDSYYRIERTTEPTGETIETFVCYTTTYGECYHAQGCSYLWNSSNKTTVYEAEKLGFRACSKCLPEETTIYEVIETHQNVVKVSEQKEIQPTTEVLCIGVSSLLALYITSIILLKRNERKWNTTHQNQSTQ